MYAKVLPLALTLWAGLAQAQAPGAECAAAPVTVARFWSRWTIEEASLRLTDCDGSPNLAALDELSILARPHGTDRPAPEARTGEGRFVAPGVARLDPGLLVRLAAIAERFPGRRIEVISGYRPRARRTSRHRHARALDIRVEGVSRAHLSEVARTLPATGVGYYPNSLFTHIDVRERSAYWVDRSGPGQPADYGAPGTPAEDVEEERREVVESAVAALDELEPAPDEPTAAAPAGAAIAEAIALEEEPPLTPEEIRELRARTLAALDALLE